MNSVRRLISLRRLLLLPLHICHSVLFIFISPLFTTIILQTILLLVRNFFIILFYFFFNVIFSLYLIALTSTQFTIKKYCSARARICCIFVRNIEKIFMPVPDRCVCVCDIESELTSSYILWLIKYLHIKSTD